MGEYPRGGVVDPRFAEVAEAFEANFAAGNEIGAGVCVYQHGQPVVDLWAGYADLQQRQPWRADTLGVLASPTKALVAASALLLVDRGVLELDTPIARYWPEFAANGKDTITLRMILSHRSGVVCLDHSPITAQALKEHTPIAEALAAASPQWEPDTAHGYHAVTFGHLVSELIRRRTGATVGQFFAKEIAAPLGLDCYISIPNPDTVHLATMQQSKAEDLMEGGDAGEMTMLIDRTTLTYRATIGSLDLEHLPEPTLEDPSYGGRGSAQSMARFFAALIGDVDGVRLLSPETVDQMRTLHSSGPCQVMLMPCNWGLGVQVPDHAVFPASVGLTTAFGLSGANGSYVFADPEHNLSFAYIQNAGSQEMGALDRRTGALIKGVYRSLGKLG